MCKTITIYGNSTCHASYYIALDTANVHIIYVVNTSTGVNANTHYYWTFGDGTGSSASNPVHTYVSVGWYQLCLTIYDTLINCYSTYCDSIEITNGGTLMKVLNSNQVDKIDLTSQVNSTTIYPNPSKGQVRVTLGSIKAGDAIIEVMNMKGQILQSEKINMKSGINEINLNLIEYDNGLYCINIRTGTSSKTVKLILEK